MLPPQREILPSPRADAGIRILVADPHPVVRAGLIALVGTQPDMQVIGECSAAAGPDTLRLTTELNPDVVVVELAWPGLDGVQVATRLRENRPEQPVLVLTTCEDGDTLRLVMGLGVRGYVLKRASAEELVRALRAVVAGGTFIDPMIAGHLISSAPGAAPTTELSVRERDVLRHIALGYNNKEIGIRLKLSVKTIETYKTRALKKLNLHGRVELVRHAVQCGWLTNDADGSPDAPAPIE